MKSPHTLMDGSSQMCLVGTGPHDSGKCTIINTCSWSFMHIKADMIKVLCICVFMQFLMQDRMMSMTLDKDNEVALQTMKLLILISK